MEQSFIGSPRPGSKKINSEAGFTLLEVISSLLITGVVAFTVLAMVNQSMNLWQKSWAWGAEDRGIRLVSRNMEDICTKIYGGGLPKGEQQGFTGEPQEFGGLIEGEDGLVRAGVRWDTEEKTIFYWVESSKGRQEKLLCEKVDEAEFSYLDREQGSWSDRWTDQTPLPAVIRLRWKTLKKTMPAVVVAIQNGRRIAAP